MASQGPVAPVRYGFILFPGFQLLDVCGPLDILNMLSSREEGSGLDLAIIAGSLDPVSTSVDGTKAMSQSIKPTHTFADAPTDIDVLFVPGGGGTRIPENIQPTIDFVRSVAPNVKYLLTVCTGSAIAAMAGILDGRRATSNKQAFAFAKRKGPNVNWVWKARWVCDGNIWSSSGVTAGIDMMYAFLAHIYGEEMAEWLSTKAEYIRHKDPNDDPFAKELLV